MSIVNNSGETSFGYDPAPAPKNIRTITNVTDPYILTINYDNLDRKNFGELPDGSSEEFQYTQDFGQGLQEILI